MSNDDEAISITDWPSYRRALDRKDPQRVEKYLKIGNDIASYTTMKLEDVLDEHSDVDASLILEGYKSAGGEE